MSVMKTTLLTNVYNEEYLLPFWLHHHKDMFDDIIIVNYYSTDKSMEICKSICPNCKIIETRNKFFGAIEIDQEIMDIENGIEGIKIMLNTTEFLLCETSIKDIFINNTSPISYGITTVAPYSKTTYNINTYSELFGNLLNNDIVYHNDINRGARQLHNFNNGNYGLGRHTSWNPSISTNKAHIIWFGFYPMNDKLLKRKLQIHTHIPESDRVQGYSYHHFFNKEQLLSINNENYDSGSPLKDINLSAYNLLTQKYLEVQRRLLY